MMMMVILIINLCDKLEHICDNIIPLFFIQTNSKKGKLQDENRNLLLIKQCCGELPVCP